MSCITFRDQYARATQMLNHALILEDDPDVWDGLSVILESRLRPSERLRLLEAVIKSLHPDDVLAALAVILPDILAGSPPPVLVEIDDDARWWADLATLPELKAWLSA